MSEHAQDHAHPAPHEHIPVEPTGFIRKYIFSIDHKWIGKQYLVTSLFFLIVGGGLAMLMRWQLAYPESTVPVIGNLLKDSWICGPTGAVSPEGFNQLVTMHGSVMIFLVIIPILVGAFGNFLIPLHVGARDVAFPILNALSYWLYLPAGFIFLASFFVGDGGAGAGWTSYPPLSDLNNSAPGMHYGQVFWLFGVFLVGFSSILGGMNFMTTIIKLRAPGMTWTRMPLVTWAQFVTALFQLLATPVLASAMMLLMMDKLFGCSFFIPRDLAISGEPTGRAGGGHPLLWQHIFWFYSHPAVYILILPGMGLASDLLATFSRKPIFGYKVMVVSMTGIMGLGFIVWGHHMFQSGMDPRLGTAFMMSTMLIALPSGVKCFNWIATLWQGSIRFTVPMLHALSFLSMFIIGGLSGLWMAATPVDIFIHDTYYVVAHFHYVVFGGTLFAVFGGLIFWFPKMYGRMMNNTLGYIHWTLTFITFNLVFFPMHILGEAGAMRRVSTHMVYEYLQPIQWMNVMISHSAFILGFSQLIFIFNLFWSMYRGKVATGNPWESNTLEWSGPSPLPYHNFDKVPIVHRGPYEYSTGEGTKDWIAQDEPASAGGLGGH
ncbi:MAG: cbb3-type cytochrome c oxidase subunit I [Planctomycetota bacterium]